MSRNRKQANSLCRVLLLVLAGEVPALAGEEGEFVLRPYNDSGYTITYSFTTAAPYDTILARLFRYEHLDRYLRGLVLTIDLVDSCADSNRLRYEYHYLIYSLAIILGRHCSSHDSLVSFELEKAMPSTDLLPIVRTSTGGYRISRAAGNGFRVEYRQTTWFDRHLYALHFAVIKRDTRGVLRKQRKYIER